MLAGILGSLIIDGWLCASEGASSSVVWLMGFFFTQEPPSSTSCPLPQNKNNTKNFYFSFFKYLNWSGIDVVQAWWSEWPLSASNFLVYPCATHPCDGVYLKEFCPVHLAPIWIIACATFVYFLIMEMSFEELVAIALCEDAQHHYNCRRPWNK